MNPMVLIGWYVFCAMLISMVLLTMRGLTHAKFRDEDDSTTEVGYEKDSVGRDLHVHDETTNDDAAEPHVSMPAGAGSS
jgi:hypothetical protein